MSRTSGERSVLEALAAALRREGHVLQRRPDLLWQQVANRVRHGHDGATGARTVVEDELAARMRHPPAPWLLLRTDVYGSDALLRTLLGHTAAVTSCRFVPGSPAIVSAGLDRTARLWDAGTGAPEHVLAGHRDAIEACDASPDGRRVATASTDGTLGIWDVATGVGAGRFAGHDDAVLCCAFHPDGSRVVSGSKDRTCRVWDTSSGRCLLVVREHDDPVSAVAVAPDGRTVASASRGAVVLWESGSGRVSRRLHLDAHVTSCGFSPDGSMVVAACWDGAVRVWNAATGAEVAQLPHGVTVTAAGLWADGATVLSSDSEGRLWFWDLPSSTVKAGIEGHAGAIERCAVNDDLTVVVSAGDDRALRTWDVLRALREVPAGIRPTRPQVHAVAIAPAGRLLAALGHGVAGLEHDEIRGFTSVSAPVPYEDGAISSVACDGELGLVATGRMDGTVHLHSIGRPRPQRFTGDGGWVTACAVSPGGRLVAGGTRGGLVTVWDVASSRQLAVLAGHDERVTGCAFSPDGTHLATGSWDESVRVWQVATATTRALLVGHEDRVGCCRFTPDGSRVVSGGWDGTLRLWEVGSGALVRTVRAHDGPVNCCAASGDGRWLASGGADGALVIRTAEGAEVCRFVGAAPLRSCELGHDGTLVCATDEAEALYVFDAVGLDRHRTR